MKQDTRNYSRFYALLSRLDIRGDREAIKRELVRSYSDGRTSSLREMSDREYRNLCDGLERQDTEREQLRKKRSACLRLMQQLGIDTTDWNKVNTFCRQPRIAGVDFARLSPENLDNLSRKLRAMKNKRPSPRKSTLPYQVRVGMLFEPNLN